MNEFALLWMDERHVSPKRSAVELFIANLAMFILDAFVTGEVFIQRSLSRETFVANIAMKWMFASVTSQVSF